MREKPENKLSLFAENIAAIRNDFVWQEAGAKRLVALVYALDGKEINNTAVAEAHGLIKRESGIFSVFRGELSIYTAAVMSLSQDASRLFEDIRDVYEKLKAEGFWSSNFLAAAALEIAVNAGGRDFGDITRRTREFNREMKANHRFQVGEKDHIFAAMLAMTDIEPHEGANKLKQLFLQLKAEFSFFTSGGGLLSLAQMLILGGSTEDCVRDMLRLNRVLRNHKIRLDRAHTLPSLGVLGLMKIDHYDLVSDIEFAMEFLRGQKGLGAFSVSTQELLIYAVSILVSAYTGEDDLMKGAAVTSVASLVMAQQAALITCVTTSVIVSSS